MALCCLVGVGMNTMSVNTVEDTHAGQEIMGDHPFGFDSFDPLAMIRFDALSYFIHI